MVTVVIPLYNKESTVLRAVESVLAGSVLPGELLVVDDGSTDGSVAALEAVSSPLLRIIRQENRGAAGARNTGIRAAKGDLIAFLDADDTWFPACLETLLALREAFPGAGLYGGGYAVWQAGQALPARIPGIPPHPWQGLLDDLFDQFCRANPFNSDTVLIPKTVFDEVGLFMEGEAIGEDVQMWLRIRLHYPVAYSTELCAVYRTDAPLRAYVPSRPLHAAGYARWLEEIAPAVPEAWRPSVRRLREHVELGRLSSLVNAGERRKALAVYRAFPFRALRKQSLCWAALALLPRPLYTRLKSLRKGG